LERALLPIGYLLSILGRPLYQSVSTARGLVVPIALHDANNPGQAVQEY
jgi:hypothetical protein